VLGLASHSNSFTALRKYRVIPAAARAASLEHETECAVTEARRIIQNIPAIETAFPVGFGLMAKEIGSWSGPG
jgi:hypothetical protein